MVALNPGDLVTSYHSWGRPQRKPRRFTFEWTLGELLRCSAPGRGPPTRNGWPDSSEQSWRSTLLASGSCPSNPGAKCGVSEVCHTSGVSRAEGITLTQRLSSADEYARKLAILGGNDFEDEVVVALQQTDHAFQRVPRKPNGDGGLDGISHQRTVVYCCYGLELVHEPGLTATQRRKELVKKVVSKFKGDLMRILELEFQKKQLRQTRNRVLEGLYRSSPAVRIKNIKLIVNWFEDNRIVGELQAALQELLTKSACRFAVEDVQIVIWGPKDLASNVRITQTTLARVEHPSLMAAIKQAATAATHHEPSDDQDHFKSKFDDLARRNPSRAETVEALRSAFKRSWSTSILLDERLARDLPEIHRAFETARPRAAEEARLASLQPGVDPTTVIDRIGEKLRTLMAEAIPGLPDFEKSELARAETARLIGECPLDWRQP